MKVFINLACILLVGHLLDATLIKGTPKDTDFDNCSSLLTQEDKVKVNSEKFDNATPTLINYLKCALVEGGIIKNGAVDVGGVYKAFQKDNSKEAIKAVIDQCKDITSNNATELAYTFFMCFRKADV